MRYKNKYPNPTHLQIFKEGIVFHNGKPYPCWNCHELTQFYDIDFQAPLCSEECSLVKWREYVWACRRAYEKDYFIENN